MPPTHQWHVGQDVLARDKTNSWYPGQIITVDESTGHLTVHFSGWSRRDDRTFAFGSESVRSKEQGVPPAKRRDSTCYLCGKGVDKDAEGRAQGYACYSCPAIVHKACYARKAEDAGILSKRPANEAAWFCGSTRDCLDPYDKKKVPGLLHYFSKQQQPHSEGSTGEAPVAAASPASPTRKRQRPTPSAPKGRSDDASKPRSPAQKGAAPRDAPSASSVSPQDVAVVGRRRVAPPPTVQNAAAAAAPVTVAPHAEAAGGQAYDPIPSIIRKAETDAHARLNQIQRRAEVAKTDVFKIVASLLSTSSPSSAAKSRPQRGKRGDAALQAHGGTSGAAALAATSANATSTPDQQSAATSPLAKQAKRAQWLTSDSAPEQLLGCHVSKHFAGHGDYKGEIVNVSLRQQSAEVLFEDGDREKMPITTARRLAVQEQSREKRALRHSEQGRESTDGRSPLKKQAAIDLDDEEEDVDVADPAAQAEASPTVDAAALDDDRKDLKASLKAAEGRAAAAEAKATAAEARAAVAQAEAAALRIRLDLAAKALGALQSALCDQAAE